MRRLITHCHPAPQPAAQALVLYDDSTAFAITDLTPGAGKAKALHWPDPDWAGAWLAPATAPKLAMVMDDGPNTAASMRLYRGLRAGADWDVAGSSEGYAGQVKFDAADRNVGYATTAYQIPVLNSPGVPGSLAALVNIPAGSYTHAEVMASYTDYRADYAPITLYGTQDGGDTWAASVIGYLGQLLPSRLRANSNVPYAFGRNDEEPWSLSPSGAWVHTTSEWAAAWPLMTYEYSQANYYFMTPTYVASIPHIATDVEIATHPSTVADCYRVLTASSITASANLTMLGPYVYDTLVAPVGGSTCYLMIPCRSSAASVAAVGGFTWTVSPLWGATPGYEQPTVPTERTNFLYRIPSTGTASYIEVPNGGSYITVACADPTDIDRLYVLTEDNRAGLITWNSGTVVDLAIPADPGYPIQNLLVTASGTVLVSRITDAQTELLVYRSTNAGSSWSTIDLSASLPVSPGQDSLPMAQTSAGTVLMILSSGKVAVSGDDGATWNATAAILPILDEVYTMPVSAEAR